MKNKNVFLMRYIAIPITFLITLAVCLPFEKMLSVPWIFEWGVTNPSSKVASSLITAYATVVLLYTYILLGKVPVIMAPILALLTGLFSSDYYELHRFVFLYPAAYQEQIISGQRTATSFLWSSSMFHLLCGLIVLILLKINWNKKKIALFLLAPWVFYAVKFIYPLDITSIKIGFLGVITAGVAIDLPNRIFCWGVLSYLLLKSEWRGVKPLLIFISGVLKILKEGEFLGYVKWSLRYLVRGDWALGSEMAFWEYDLKKKSEADQIEATPYDLIFVLQLLRTRFNVMLRVLELGPGPRSRLTLGYRDGSFDLVAIDPLAEDYKKYLGGEKFLVQGFGEEIDKMFPPETFHMGYASNVLDHSKDPAKCLRNMVSLIKCGGIIIVQGNTNEGDRSEWKGLHRFNIWLDNDKLMCRTRDGAPIDLTEGLHLRKIDEMRIDFSGNPWFSVSYEVVTHGDLE